MKEPSIQEAFEESLGLCLQENVCRLVLAELQMMKT